MSKFLYGLAVFAVVIGFVDSSSAIPGSHAAIEAGILFLLSPVFAAAGFFVSRAQTKVCRSCAERIKKAATKCKFCGNEQ